jgi:hypothetical protein
MKTLSRFADVLVLWLLMFFLMPAALAQTPQATSTSLTAAACTAAWTCTPRSAIAGEFVQFSVVVTSAGAVPAGSVQWFLDGAPIATAQDLLSATGTSNWFTPHLSVGTHSVTAKYLGAPNFAASSSATVTQIVTAIAAPGPPPAPLPAPAPLTVAFLMPANCKLTLTATGLAYDCTLQGIAGHLTGVIPLGTTLDATATFSQ